MSRINTTDELYQTMRLDGINDSQDIEKMFSDIADSLLNNFVIKRGEKEYRFVEIEFYHNNICEIAKKYSHHD